MKKLMSLLVAVALVAFMTACGDTVETAQDQAVQDQAVQQEAPAQEAPAQEAPAEDGQATEEGAE